MTPPRGAALLLSALVLAACGSGAERTADPTLEVETSDLAVMVLPPEELGELVAGLRLVADDSGEADNARAARVSLDPEDTGKTMKALGRVGGYDLVYRHPKYATGKVKKGVVGVASSIDLMGDAADASRFLNLIVGEYEQQRAKVPGVRISGVKTFAIPPLGDEAFGVRVRVRSPGSDVRTAFVAFRRGRLVGSVAVARAREAVDAEEVTRLATALDARIGRALAGELDEKPVPLPGRKGRRVDPKPLTLRLADLPAGLTVQGEDYERSGGFRYFVRSFAVPDGRLGGSKALRLVAAAWVADSEDAAVVDLGYAASAAGSRELQRQVIEGALGRAPRKLGVKALEIEIANAKASVATFGTPAGRLTSVLLVVRSGRALGMLIAMARDGELDPADVLALAPKLRARLAAGE